MIGKFVKKEMIQKITGSNDDMEFINFYCGHCGSQVTQTDSKYIKDYPLASTGHLNRQRDDHEDNECRFFNQYQQETT